MISNDVKLVKRFRGGHTISELPPVFSDDSECVYIKSRNIIQSFSTKTGKYLHQFNCDNEIVGFSCCHLNGEEYLVTCTRKAHITLWKPKICIPIKEYNVNKLSRVVFFKIIPQRSGENNTPTALITYGKPKESCRKFLLFNLENGHIQKQKFFLEGDQYLIDVGINYFIVLLEELIYFVKFGSKAVHKHSIKDKYFTCLMCHPTEEVVLTGDNLGRVILWQTLDKIPIKTIYHWHNMPVNTVAFSASGTSFYSGASEYVLVKWHFEDNNLKQFLPRLPASIMHSVVATDNKYIAITTQDNGIHILDSHFEKVSLIQQLALNKDYSAGIAYDARTNALVMNSFLGHVQFILQKDASLLYNLDIVCQNKLPQERGIISIDTLITRLAINKTGTWMATVEERNDPNLPEQRLKFWFFNSTKQNFVLNTVIEYPHDGRLVQLTFQPSEDDHELSCATISEDRKFKIWHIYNSSDIYGKSFTWQYLGTGSYRNLSPSSLSFSSDGSILAISFGSIVTLWSPDTCQMKYSLKHVTHMEDIIHLSFGVNTECHLLVSATAESVSVWNLLTLKMVWTVRLDISFVISDSLTSNKAIFTRNRQLYVFSPISSIFLYKNDQILSGKNDIVAATFVPKLYNSESNPEWHEAATIWFFNAAKKLYSLETDVEDEISYSTEVIKSSHKSAFYHMMPKIKSGVLNSEATIHLYSKGSKLEKFKELLDAPTHTMAPLHLMCEAILYSMILDNDKPIENVSSEKDKEAEVTSVNVTTDINTNKLNEKTLARVKCESTVWISKL